MSKPTTLLACAACSVVVALCSLAAPVTAQTQPAQRRDPPRPAAPSPAPSPAATNATGEPDLSITGSVTARELQFEVVPTPKVEFPGRPRRETIWEAERTNLPPQVQPGVTYRDIGIRLKITSVFADIERIVAEALGEIPPSDDTPPKTDANENAPQPAPGNARPPAANTPAATTNEAAPTDDARPSRPSTEISPAASSTAKETFPASPSRAERAPRPRGEGAQSRRGRP